MSSLIKLMINFINCDKHFIVRESDTMVMNASKMERKTYVGAI